MAKIPEWKLLSDEQIRDINDLAAIGLAAAAIAQKIGCHWASVRRILKAKKAKKKAKQQYKNLSECGRMRWTGQRWVGCRDL